MANAQRVLSRRAASHISRRYSALVLVVSALLGGVASQMAYAQVDCGAADAERVSCAEVGNVSTGWAGWWQSFSSGTAANKAVETVTVVLENGGTSPADGIYLEVFSSNSTPNACNPDKLGGLVGTSAPRSIPDTNRVMTAFDFTFPATAVLSPNTTYYVRLVDPDHDGGDQGTAYSENKDTGDAGGAGNNCGEMAHAIYTQAADTDGDGVVDTQDPRPYDPTNAIPVMPPLVLLFLTGLLGVLGARRVRA